VHIGRVTVNQLVAGECVGPQECKAVAVVKAECKSRIVGNGGAADGIVIFAGVGRLVMVKSGNNRGVEEGEAGRLGRVRAAGYANGGGGLPGGGEIRRRA